MKERRIAKREEKDLDCKLVVLFGLIHKENINEVQTVQTLKIGQQLLAFCFTRLILLLITKLKTDE